MTKIEDFKTLFNTLTLYREILNDDLIKSLIKILDLITKE